MRRTFRILLWFTGLLLVLLLATPAILPRLIDLTLHIPEIEKKLSEALKRPVTIDHLALDLSSGVGVRADEVSIAGDESEPELAHIASLIFVIHPGAYLFDNKIELSGVVLHRPSIRLERDPATGEVALLGNKLKSHGPANLQKNLQEALQKIPIEFFRVDRGRLLLVTPSGKGTHPTDQQTPVMSAGPQVTEISEIKLSVSSLRPFTPVEFEIGANVQPGGASPGSFSIEGSWTFRSQDYSMDDAQLAVRTEFKAMDVEWLEAVPQLRGLGLERGRISGKASMIGNPFSHFTAEGVISAQNLKGNYPSLWVIPFEPRSFRVPFEFERHENFMEVRLSKADINGMDVKNLRIALNLREGKEHDYGFAMDLSVRKTDWKKDFDLYPWSVHHNPLRDQLRERISRTGGAENVLVTIQGEIRNGEMHTDYNHFTIEADLFGMKMRVGGGNSGPVLAGMDGKLHFHDSGLYFEQLDARVDDILPLRIDGGFPRIREDKVLELAIEGWVPLGDLARVLPHYAFPAFGEELAPLQKARGNVSAKARMNYDLESLKFNYNGEMRMQRINVPLSTLGVTLNDLGGELLFTHESLESSLMRAKIGDSPVRFSIAVQGPQTSQPSLEISLDGEDLDLGPIVAAAAGAKDFGATGLLSLRDLRLHSVPGTDAPVGVSGSIHIKKASLNAPFLMQPVEDLNCIMLVTEAQRNDFGCQALFGTSDIKVSGVIADEGPGRLDGRMEVESLYLDLSNILANVDWSQMLARAPIPAAEDAEPLELQVNQEVAPGVRVESVEVAPPGKKQRKPMHLARVVSLADIVRDARIESSFSIGSFEYKELRGRRMTATVATQRGVANFDELSFEGPGGMYRFNHGYLEKRPDGVFRGTVEPKLNQLDVGPFLTLMGVAEGSATGSLDMEGVVNFAGSGPAEWIQQLGGKILVRAYNGRVTNVKNIKVLAQILTLLHWKGIESYKDGVPFNEISGEFKMNNGVARTDALIFDSPKFSIRTSGKLDFAAQKVDMTAHVKISDQLDFAINQIPVVKMLTGRELSLVIPIPIKGSWKAPDVRLEAVIPENGETPPSPESTPN